MRSLDAPRPRSEDGATMTEYAVLVVLIAVALVGAVTLLGEAAAVPFTEAAVPFGP